MIDVGLIGSTFLLVSAVHAVGFLSPGNISDNPYNTSCWLMYNAVPELIPAP